MRPQRAPWKVFAAAAVLTSMSTVLITPAFSPDASAQSWLPWTTRQEPRRPPQPQPPPNDGRFRQPYGAPPYSGRASICLQLEQRLAEDARRQSGAAGAIQKLRQGLLAAQRDHRRTERQLDQRECYETFLFSRSLKPSRVCRQLDTSARTALRQIEELTTQLRQYQSGNSRERQDEIVRALARNNCGADYIRAARQRDPFTNFWQDNDTESERGVGNLFGGLPFATYRTVCVRLCDGYYFPVSFSTLPNHFPRDAQVCQARCTAPTELYFHQNPGGSVDQMTSHRTQQPYTSLPTAFRYRKEFVSGCSCRSSEFAAQDGAAGVTPVPQPAPASQAGKQADKLSPVR